jgi:hypothetical protein
VSDGKSSLIECLERARRMIRDAELEIVMHPDDVTDEVRAEVAAIPLVTLRETRIVAPGTAYMMRPGAMEALRGES